MADQQSPGPDYREFAVPLLEACARLALKVRELRPEIFALNPRAPEIVFDLSPMRAIIALRIDAERVAILDAFSIDPENPAFGLSEIPLIPSANSRPSE